MYSIHLISHSTKMGRFEAVLVEPTEHAHI